MTADDDTGTESGTTDGSNERQTATCDSCGYIGPRKGDAEADEKCILWYEDRWTCEECLSGELRGQQGSRTPRRGGMGPGGLGRSNR